jgi:hypothetical protein
MGFFNRLLGNPTNSPSARRSAEVNSMGAALLQVSGIDFDASSPLEQALVGTFFFGMATAHGMLLQLTPPEVHGLVLTTFVEEFHYSPEAAAQAAQACIDASRPGHHDTMNAILHRGIDGHRQYVSGQARMLEENIRSILAQFRA